MVNATPEIYVRQVTEADVKLSKEVHAVVNGAYRSEGGWTTEKHIVSGERATVEEIEEFVRQNGKPNVLLYAFEKNGDSETVVGTIMIQPEEAHPGEAEIGFFSVKREYQSRGIGKRLMQSALDTMRAMGFKIAVVHVLENRPELLSWYRKLGFVENGERHPFVWPDLLIIKDIHFVVMKQPL